jgi:hypothetical protein
LATSSYHRGFADGRTGKFHLVRHQGGWLSGSTARGWWFKGPGLNQGQFQRQDLSAVGAQQHSSVAGGHYNQNRNMAFIVTVDAATCAVSRNGNGSADVLLPDCGR